jgi:hypothetical protein
MDMSKNQRRKLRGENVSNGLSAEGMPMALALAHETDRGCALVAAEFLSDALELLLRTKFNSTKTPESIQQSLLSRGESPIYTFAMRSKVCMAFGLIFPPTYDALNRIREIRNPCAHRAGPIDLADKELADNLRWLEGFVKSNPIQTSGTLGGDDGTYRIGFEWDDLIPGRFTSDRKTFMDAAMLVHHHVFGNAQVLLKYGSLDPHPAGRYVVSADPIRSLINFSPSSEHGLKMPPQ